MTFEFYQDTKTYVRLPAAAVLSSLSGRAFRCKDSAGGFGAEAGLQRAGLRCATFPLLTKSMQASRTVSLLFAAQVFPDPLELQSCLLFLKMLMMPT